MGHQLQPLTKANHEAFVIPNGPVEVTVGRSGDNDFRVDDTSVSSIHASLKRNGGDSVTLIDRGSSNGTFVNGEKITRKNLQPGDLVRFASSEFRFTDVGAVNGSSEGEDTLPVSIPDTEEVTGSGEFSAIQKERDELAEQLQSLKTEKANLTIRIQGEEGKSSALIRELDIEKQKESKLAAELSNERAKNIEAEGRLAALQFELTQEKGVVERLESERSALVEQVQQWRAEKAAVDALVSELEIKLDESKRKERESNGKLEEERRRAGDLADLYEEALKFWVKAGGPDWAGEDGLTRLEGMRNSIRSELDKIEPIWSEFGEGVQEELKSRLRNLQLEQQNLVEENREKREVLETTETELKDIREKVDNEIRRAQGLSRRGTKVQLPEGYDTMVIAKDREQAIYEALITDIEFFDALLSGYRRNRKLSDVVIELEDFRKRLAEILNDQGVEEFDIPLGTVLTLKQRHEVQILGKKGWGTRDYMEQPFQPGEVTKVIRTGYRVGGGDGQGVILRKVEVLIRGLGE